MSQQDLRLPLAPKRETVELLYRTFGDVLAPSEQVRLRYFKHLDPDNFTRALKSLRVPLPVTTLDDSTKAHRFIDIRHLAIHIDARADQADDELDKAINPPQAEQA